MNILYISPHTDDLECWSGATIAHLVEKGHKVLQLICIHKFSYGSLRENSEACSDLLGIKTDFLGLSVTRLHEHFSDITNYLYNLNKKKKFDIVFIPCRQDWHPDHQTITRGAISVFRESTILGYIKKEIWDRKLDFRSPAGEKHYSKKISLLKLYDLRVEDVGLSFDEWFEVIQVRHPIW